MPFGDFKDLPRKTAFDKVLRLKAFNTAKNTKYDEYQGGIASLVYKFFDKNSSGANTSGGAVTRTWSETVDRKDKFAIENKIMSSQELSKELHKPIVTKFEKQKVHSLFIDNIWDANLVISN